MAAEEANDESLPIDHHKHEEEDQQQQQPEEHDDDDVVDDVDMDTLIENQQWDQVVALLEASPEQAKRIVNPSLGWTKLHWLCSIGWPAPTHLIAMVARLYPQAITMPDNRYGDTPLHIICRNSVTNAIKLRILLSHIVTHHNDENDDDNANDTTNNNNDTTTTPPLAQPPTPSPPTPPSHCSMAQGQQQGLLIRNRFGATALHSACNHNAVLGVLKALVQADPRIVRVTTHDGVHAISALYSGYVQTIPGTMSVARILRGERLLLLDNTQPHVDPAIPAVPAVPADPPTDTTNATTAPPQVVETDTTNAATTAPQQDQSQAAHFDRFWKKVEYLATAVYLQSKNNNSSSSSSSHGAPTTTTTHTTLVENTEESANGNHDDNEEQDHDHDQYRFVLHGLLQSHGVSLNFYQLALQWNPLYAQVVDEETGNLPLHVLLERRPFRLYERQAIQATLQAYPQAAARRNHGGNNGNKNPDNNNDNNNNNSNNNTGDLPLLIAVRNKIPWHNGLDLIAQASPASSAIAGRDAVTGLWPFQLAASVGGRVAVETTFELLKNQPDLLSV